MQQKTKPSQINQTKPVLLVNSWIPNQPHQFKIIITCCKSSLVKIFTLPPDQSGKSLRRLFRIGRVELPSNVIIPPRKKSFLRPCKRCGTLFRPIKNKLKDVCENCSKRLHPELKKQEGVTK